MLQTKVIEPARMTMADLEILEAEHAPKGISVLSTKWQPPQLTKRDVRQRVFGTLKLLVFLCGGDMRKEVDAADFLVRRIDALEDEAQKRETYIQQLIEKHEAEKVAYRNSQRDVIAGYKKALRNIAGRLELYRTPFEELPFSKWKNEAKGKWMLAAGETIDWAVQRADNQLDPINAVVIAADED